MILYIDGISFSYGSYPVLNGVNMKVEPGQVVSIVGPNGSGKSTFMRCLTRILKPQKGKVFLDGREISRINSRELAKLMGYVPQSVGEAFSYTVLETVLLGRKPRMDWSVGDQDLEKVAQVLEFMDLEILADRTIDELSGGQKQRVFIARALAQEPNVFLFDEPTSSLDIKHQLEVLSLVQYLAHRERRHVIMVLHDLNLAARFSHLLVMLKKGMVYAAGSPEEVLTEENIKAVYDVRAKIIKSSSGPLMVPLAPLDKEKYSKVSKKHDLGW